MLLRIFSLSIALCFFVPAVTIITAQADPGSEKVGKKAKKVAKKARKKGKAKLRKAKGKAKKKAPIVSDENESEEIEEDYPTED